MQYWLIERPNDDGVRRLYFCNSSNMTKAKRFAQEFLQGNPDDYIVTPLTNPGDIVRMQINVSSVMM